MHRAPIAVVSLLLLLSLVHTPAVGQELQTKELWSVDFDDGTAPGFTFRYLKLRDKVVVDALGDPQCTDIGSGTWWRPEPWPGTRWQHVVDPPVGLGGMFYYGNPDLVQYESCDGTQCALMWRDIDAGIIEQGLCNGYEDEAQVFLAYNDPAVDPLPIPDTVLGQKTEYIHLTMDAFVSVPDPDDVARVLLWRWYRDTDGSWQNTTTEIWNSSAVAQDAWVAVDENVQIEQVQSEDFYYLLFRFNSDIGDDGKGVWVDNLQVDFCNKFAECVDPVPFYSNDFEDPADVPWSWTMMTMTTERCSATHQWDISDTDTSSLWQVVPPVTHGNPTPSLYYGDPTVWKYDSPCQWPASPPQLIDGVCQCQWWDRWAEAISEPIVIPEQIDGGDVERAILTFNAYISAETGWDYVQAVLRRADASEILVWEKSGLHEATWDPANPVGINLSAFATPDTYRLVFKFYSDYIIQWEGAYLDNMKVEAEYQVVVPFVPVTLFEEDFEEDSWDENLPGLETMDDIDFSTAEPMWFRHDRLAESCFPPVYNIDQLDPWDGMPDPPAVASDAALYFGIYDQSLDCTLGYPYQHHYFHQDMTGKLRSHGTIATKTLNLPADEYAGLYFDYWMKSEGMPGVDFMNVWWVPDGGTLEEHGQLVYTSEYNHNQTFLNWKRIGLYLVDQKGTSGQLFFEFDSVDGVNNSHVGTFVDNLKVETVPSEPIEECLKGKAYIMLMIDRSSSMSTKAVFSPGGVAISPEIELPNAQHIKLSFDARWELNYNVANPDEFVVRVIDRVEKLKTDVWVGTDTGDEHVEIDLSSMRGKKIDLRFQLRTRATANRVGEEGIFLDNVEITWEGAGPFVKWDFQGAGSEAGWYLEGNGCRKLYAPNNCDFTNPWVTWQRIDLDGDATQGKLWFGVPELPAGTYHYNCECLPEKWPLVLETMIQIVDTYKGNVVFGLRGFPGIDVVGCAATTNTDPSAINFDDAYDGPNDGYVSSVEVLEWLKTHQFDAVGGQTPLADTLQELRTTYIWTLDTSKRNIYILALTSAQASCGALDSSYEVDLLRAMGVDTFVIGYNSDQGALDVGELNVMAEKGGRAVILDDVLYYKAQDTADLNQAMKEIALGIGDETCDSVDNDCDGLIDEGVALTGCLVNGAACTAMGYQACLGDGELTDCEFPEEFCNGRDDNCDGTTDEPWSLMVDPPLGGPCDSTDKDPPLYGMCYSEGIWACAVNQREVECRLDALLLPEEETCNCVDDDCNGLIDDEVVMEDPCLFPVLPEVPPPPCVTVLDCDQTVYAVCKDGQCIMGECVADGDCPANRVCHDGICVLGRCSGQIACECPAVTPLAECLTPEGEVLGSCPGEAGCECVVGPPVATWTACAPFEIVGCTVPDRILCPEEAGNQCCASCGNVLVSGDGTDCDAAAETIADALPQAEVCDNGLDDDCDGLVDLRDPDCCHRDLDQDGFGDTEILCNCIVNPGCGVPDNTDCCDGPEDYFNEGEPDNPDDDTGWFGCNEFTAPLINPAAKEVCDDMDNNCNGVDPFMDFLAASISFCENNREPHELCCDAVEGDECHNEALVCTPDCFVFDNGPSCEVEDCPDGLVCSSIFVCLPSCATNDECPAGSYCSLATAGGVCEPDLFACMVCSLVDQNWPEECDGLDNDCDGRNNEDAGQICQIDADEDGQLDHLDEGCILENPCACVQVGTEYHCVHE